MSLYAVDFSGSDQGDIGPIKPFRPEKLEGVKYVSEMQKDEQVGNEVQRNPSGRRRRSRGTNGVNVQKNTETLVIINKNETETIGAVGVDLEKAEEKQVDFDKDIKDGNVGLENTQDHTQHIRRRHKRRHTESKEVPPVQSTNTTENEQSDNKHSDEVRRRRSSAKNSDETQNVVSEKVTCDGKETSTTILASEQDITNDVNSETCKNDDIVNKDLVEETERIPTLDKGALPPVPATSCSMTLPKVIKKEENMIFRIARKVVMSLTGRQTFFDFYLLSERIYSAKYKHGKEMIPIIKGTDSNFDGPMDSCVILGNKASDFDLRRKSKTGVEILAMRFYPSTKEDPHRRFVVTFFSPLENAPLRLFSRQPTVYNNGKLTFDFGGRFHHISVKNAILYEKKSSDDLLWIRKTGVDVLEIETAFPVEPLAVFGIGIGSFVTDVK